jgi:thiol-disulfide isomerase/thioredoxin
MARRVISELSVADVQRIQAGLGDNQVLLIKFGADWCGPCKKIAPLYYDFIKTNPPNILFADIDVDDNIDLYITLKKNKMLNGIPVFLAYFGNSRLREKWYIPDDSIVGADETAVAAFFARCLKQAQAQAQVQAQGYTYFS